MKQMDLMQNCALRGFLRKRRGTALTVYGIFALMQAVLAVWLITDFGSKTQFYCFLVEIAAIVWLCRIVRHLSLSHALSPLREGEVVSETIQQTTVPEIPFAKCKGKQVELMTAKLAINASGHIYLLELKEADQSGLFAAGDRVLFSNALAAPILTNRIPTKYVCPFCGAIFPLTQETTVCRCGSPVLSAGKEESVG